jgi:hypothetical protein
MVLAMTAALMGLTGCDDDPAPQGEDELGVALQRLADDPAAARDFLTGGRPTGTADAIEAADVPDEDRVAWLAASARGWSDAVADDVGATVQAATTEPGDGDVTALVDQVLGSAGEPGSEDDTIDPRVRADLAAAAAAQPAAVFDALAEAAAREPDWHLDPAHEFLVEAAQDDDARTTLKDALTAEADHRLLPTPEARLEVRNEQVGVPLGRMVGTLVRAGDRDGFYDERQALTLMVKTWARANTDDEELAINLAGDVGASFIDQFSDRWDSTTEPAGA